MINRIKMSIIALVAFAMPMAPIAVSAQTQNVSTSTAACAGANLDASAVAGGTAVNCDTGTDEDARINDLVVTIINIFTWVVGVVAVIMIIIAGFRYVVSGGDSGSVGGAKNTIIYAIVGLIVVILAQVIVRFVVQNINA